MAPALAVAGALRAEDVEVTFIGGQRAEAQLVPEAGYELRTLTVEGVSRTNPLRAARALTRAALAVPRARAILKEVRPDAVMGGGGYVTAPVGLAALSLGVPLVLTEADSHLGLANRLLARRARAVCLALAIPGREDAHEDAGRAPAGRYASRKGRRRQVRYRLTGRPIPVPDADRASAREWLGIAQGETCVLVFGGSLGARSINLAAIEGLAGLAGSPPIPAGAGPPTIAESTESGWGAAGAVMTGGRGVVRILHVAGRRDYPGLSRHELPPGYDLREYLDLEEFAKALAASDLVVARAGGSVAEIAAYGKPAILVPYPYASADHQSANARWMEQSGAAVTIPDAELSADRLRHEVQALLDDPEQMEAMAKASLSLARPNAAREIARELLEAAGA